MKIRLVLPFVALVAGCGEPYGVKSGDGPMKPGIYEATQPDGTKTRMVFHENGDYFDMADNKPKPVDQGKWRRRGDELCLESSVSETKTCFQEKAAGDDGVFTITIGETIGTFRALALSP